MKELVGGYLYPPDGSIDIKRYSDFIDKEEEEKKDEKDYIINSLSKKIKNEIINKKINEIISNKITIIKDLANLSADEFKNNDELTKYYDNMKKDMTSKLVPIKSQYVIKFCKLSESEITSNGTDQLIKQGEKTIKIDKADSNYKDYIDIKIDEIKTKRINYYRDNFQTIIRELDSVTINSVTIDMEDAKSIKSINQILQMENLNIFDLNPAAIKSEFDKFFTDNTSICSDVDNILKKIIPFYDKFTFIEDDNFRVYINLNDMYYIIHEKYTNCQTITHYIINEHLIIKKIDVKPDDTKIIGMELDNRYDINEYKYVERFLSSNKNLLFTTENLYNFKQSYDLIRSKDTIFKISSCNEKIQEGLIDFKIMNDKMGEYECIIELLNYLFRDVSSFDCHKEQCKNILDTFIMCGKLDNIIQLFCSDNKAKDKQKFVIEQLASIKTQHNPVIDVYVTSIPVDKTKLKDKIDHLCSKNDFNYTRENLLYIINKLEPKDEIFYDHSYLMINIFDYIDRNMIDGINIVDMYNYLNIIESTNKFVKPNEGLILSTLVNIDTRIKSVNQIMKRTENQTKYVLLLEIFKLKCITKEINTNFYPMSMEKNGKTESINITEYIIYNYIGTRIKNKNQVFSMFNINLFFHSSNIKFTKNIKSIDNYYKFVNNNLLSFINGADHGNMSGGIPRVFSSCGESAVLNLIIRLIYNKDTKKLDYRLLPENTMKPIVDFFKECKTIYILEKKENIIKFNNLLAGLVFTYQKLDSYQKLDAVKSVKEHRDVLEQKYTVYCNPIYTRPLSMGDKKLTFQQAYEYDNKTITYTGYEIRPSYLNFVRLFNQIFGYHKKNSKYNENTIMRTVNNESLKEILLTFRTENIGDRLKDYKLTKYNSDGDIVKFRSIHTDESKDESNDECMDNKNLRFYTKCALNIDNIKIIFKNSHAYIIENDNSVFKFQEELMTKHIYRYDSINFDNKNSILFALLFTKTSFLYELGTYIKQSIEKSHSKFETTNLDNLSFYCTLYQKFNYLTSEEKSLKLNIIHNYNSMIDYIYNILNGMYILNKNDLRELDSYYAGGADNKPFNILKNIFVNKIFKYKSKYKIISSSF